MRFSKVIFLLTALSMPTLILSGCANPYNVNASLEEKYQPPHYGTYPDSPYYDNDYYENYKENHFGEGDHLYDSTYGPNQVYLPSKTTP